MTTPRPHARTRRAAAILTLTLGAAVGLATFAGCDPRTLAYFLQPNEPTIPPPKEAPSLEEKKVVVLTHTVSGAMGEFQSLDRDLTKKVVAIFREKVKKITVVEPDKVWNWVDDHPHWTDSEELAKAFDADLVIYLEVETFQLHNPGDIGVFQGTAKTHIIATEMVYPKNDRGKPDKKQPKEPKQAYDDFCDTIFPIRGPIQMDSGVSRGAFKSRFLQVVASEITWHFVGHAPEDDIQDVKFNGR
jgi:hypothetical protein